MSILFSDKVQITPITTDEEYGEETEGTPFASKAFVEDESKIRYNASGQPIAPDIIICLPKDVSIQEGYYIEVTELHGEIPNVQEAQRRKVRRVSRIGAFNVSHIEVIV